MEAQLTTCSDASARPLAQRMLWQKRIKAANGAADDRALRGGARG
ncbi:MAG: hypothetical protein R3B13_38250 [Polyangiaceae bacterium]